MAPKKSDIFAPGQRFISTNKENLLERPSSSGFLFLNGSMKDSSRPAIYTKNAGGNAVESDLVENEMLG
jgi:hypothetical protein